MGVQQDDGVYRITTDDGGVGVTTDDGSMGRIWANT